MKNLYSNLLVHFRQPLAQGNSKYKKTLDNQTEPKRWNIKYYYQTHRAYNHKDKFYRTKAKGHQDQATKENKIGRSKAFYS